LVLFPLRSSDPVVKYPPFLRRQSFIISSWSAMTFAPKTN
jgi:hypothetical protein